ncbi:hypothetical protein C0W80_18340 [Photobacterium leiognathi subsp. mandapamensis]|uniref:hypothetical protein n=1 Tax=Photobacterium leiognathi TaxID=553611 RepID=UPI000D177B49|nr:hypothetical protein [Photobacterium leiognathi]PSU96069.1 hypothetical protein C0W80_18340 [Photobacterium leiognathi subsp. mandapamensis]
MNINFEKRIFLLYSVFLIVLQGYSKVIFFDNEISQKIVFYSLVFSFLAYFLFIKYDKKDLLILFLSVIAFLSLGNGSALKLFLILIVLKYFPLRKVLKNYLIINVLFYVFVIFVLKADYGSNIYTREINGVYEIRNTLGFDNPNKAFYYLVPIIIPLVILYMKRCANLLSLGILLISILIFKETLSQTGFYLNVLLSIIILIYNIKDGRILRKVSFGFIAYTPIILLLLALVLPLFLNPDAFSMRMYYWSLYLRDYFSIKSLLGYSMVSEYPLDGSYIYGVIYFGVIFTVFVIFKYIKIIKEFLVNKKRFYLIIPVFYMLAYGFSETNLFEVAFNPTLLLLFLNYSQEKNEL